MRAELALAVIPAESISVVVTDPPQGGFIWGEPVMTGPFADFGAIWRVVRPVEELAWARRRPAWAVSGASLYCGHARAGPPAEHILMGITGEVVGAVSVHLVPEAPARRQDAGREGASALTARRPLAGFVRRP